MPPVRALFVLALAVVGATTAPADAQPARARPEAGGPGSADRLVSVRLAADVDAIEPGHTFHVGVILEIEPEWHVYWHYPGDTGAPTEVTLKAPGGFRVGATRYPRPETMQDAAGVSYGYDDEVVLFVPVTAPKTLPAGPTRFEAEVLFFVCRERCFMGRATKAIELPSAAGARSPGDRRATPARDADVLARHVVRVPRPLASVPGGDARVEREGDTTRLVLTGPRDGFDTVQVFPVSTPAVAPGTPKVTFDGGRFRVELPLDLRPHNALGKPMRIAGVVGVGRDEGDPSYSFDVPIAATGARRGSTSPAAAFTRPASWSGPRPQEDDRPAPAVAKVGEKAPDFVLSDSEGKRRKLSDYRGKIVVLEWTDPQCLFVRTRYTRKTMQKTYERVRASDGKVMWLALESTRNATAAKVEFWRNTYKIKYPVLLDTDGAVARRYDARRTPHMFVIDGKGVLRYQGAIDDDEMADEKPEDVKNYVVNAVQQLTDGDTVDPAEVKAHGCRLQRR